MYIGSVAFCVSITTEGGKIWINEIKNESINIPSFSEMIIFERRVENKT